MQGNFLVKLEEFAGLLFQSFRLCIEIVFKWRHHGEGNQCTKLASLILQDSFSSGRWFYFQIKSDKRNDLVPQSLVELTKYKDLTVANLQILDRDSNSFIPFSCTF